MLHETYGYINISFVVPSKPWLQESRCVQNNNNIIIKVLIMTALYIGVWIVVNIIHAYHLNSPRWMSNWWLKQQLCIWLSLTWRYSSAASMMGPTLIIPISVMKPTNTNKKHTKYSFLYTPGAGWHTIKSHEWGQGYKAISYCKHHGENLAELSSCRLLTMTHYKMRTL